MEAGDLHYPHQRHNKQTTSHQCNNSTHHHHQRSQLHLLPRSVFRTEIAEGMKEHWYLLPQPTAKLKPESEVRES